MWRKLYIVRRESTSEERAERSLLAIKNARHEPSSLHRITELLSRIKYLNRGIFCHMTFSVVDQFFRGEKTSFFFFPDELV